jgi:hypothetical protein
MENMIEISKKFWSALEKSDTNTMRSLCNPDCYFVHIGGNCGLDEEMQAFDDGVFKPTEIILIALPIKHCRQDEDRKEIYQGRNRKAYFRMSRISDAEKFSLCRVLVARFSWWSNTKQEVKSFGDTEIVITDCNYGLLLDEKPTTHHFAVTEVYKNSKLIQFTFTALVY